MTRNQLMLIQLTVASHTKQRHKFANFRNQVSKSETQTYIDLACTSFAGEQLLSPCPFTVGAANNQSTPSMRPMWHVCETKTL